MKVAQKKRKKFFQRIDLFKNQIKNGRKETQPDKITPFSN